MTIQIKPPGGSATNATTEQLAQIRTDLGVPSAADAALTGTPTAPTAASGTNTTQIATTAFVKAAVDGVLDAAPGALDTLNELAAAIGDDANFAATMTTALGSKAPIASPTFTGTPAAPTAAAGTNTTQLATTAYTRAEILSRVLTGLSTADSSAATASDSVIVAIGKIAAGLALRAPLTPTVSGDSDGTHALIPGETGQIIDLTNASGNAVSIGTGASGYAFALAWPASAAPPVLTPTGVTLNGGSSAITGAAGPGCLYVLPIGANAFRVVGSILGTTKVFSFAVGNETDAITTGTGKRTVRMPFAMTVTEVRASMTTAPTGSTAIFDINEGGVSIFSTRLSIDATEKTSTTAATPAVLSDATLADDAEITVDFDQVGSTVAGAGVKITLIGY